MTAQKQIHRQDAHDVVPAALVDGKTGVGQRGGDLHQLRRGDGAGHGLHKFNGDHNILGVLVPELHGGVHQLHLLRLQNALVLQGVDDGDQVLLGDGAAAVLAEESGQHIGDAGKNGGNGSQQPDQGLHAAGEQQGDLLRTGPGQALGQHLRKEIDDHRGDHGAHRNESLTKLPQHQQSRQGGAGRMEHIVAHQNGRQGLVEPITDPQCPLGTLVALVRQGPQADLADSGIGRLRTGKIGRAHQEKHIQEQTRRVQRKPTP